MVFPVVSADDQAVDGIGDADMAKDPADPAAAVIEYGISTK